MAWQPPDPNEVFGTLKWLGLAGLLAAIINLLRLFVDRRSQLAWWQKLFNGLLVGLLTVGVGSLLITAWPTMPFFALLGLASMAGYLGGDFLLWIAWRTLGYQRHLGRDKNTDAP